jgi:iron complex outermembrane recepter protein
MTGKIAFFGVALGVLAVSLPGIAQAQATPVAASPPSDQIEEIVVTAEKRSENLQDAAIAVTAITGAALDARHIVDVQSLAESLPNFDFGVYSGNAHLAMRGLGLDSVNPGAEGRVAFYDDGVYISRPADVLGTFFDVSRVEALRGPQGTLYGRNATGGSINLITNDPTSTLRGYYEQTVGNFGQTIEEGAISGPIVDRIQGRFAFQVDDHSGYGHNLVTGSQIDNARTFSFRGKLNIEISDSVDLRLSADYHKEHDANYGFHYMGAGNPTATPTGVLLGAPSVADSYDIATAENPRNDRNIWGAAAVTTWKISDTTSLKSITGYRYSKYNDFSDATGEGFNLLPFDQVEQSNSESEELQLAQTNDKYNWIAGLYYFHEYIDSFSLAPLSAGLFGGPVAEQLEGYWAGGNLRTTAAAVFGEFNYHFTDKFAATAGLRYGWEKKSVIDGLQFDVSRLYSPSNPLDLAATQNDSITQNAVTPKAGLNYEIAANVLSYFTVSKGYKSGGFDNGAVAPPYGAETVWAYELGLKGQWFDRRLQSNLAAFLYEATNLQVSVIQDTQVFTKNAAAADAKGIEEEITAVLAKGLKADASVGYLISRYKSFTTADPQRPYLGPIDLAGRYLPQAPTTNLQAGLQQTWDTAVGALTLRGEGYYVSKIYFTPFNVDVNSMGGNFKANAFLNYLSGDEHWSGQLYGRNLTDKKVIAYSTPTSAFDGFPVVGYLEPPRTYGVQVGFHF